MDQHLHQFRNWQAFRRPEPDPDVSKTYSLDEDEKIFLGQTKQIDHIADKVQCHRIHYPNASELRSYCPTVPIPCIHRIHEGSERDLKGAQSVQAQIGMSLPLQEIEVRLRQLAELHQMLPRHVGDDVKALVTVDDGFRDVLLLRSVFRELSPFLQPVLFVPSGLLMDMGEEKHQSQEDQFCRVVRRRHLPLTWFIYALFLSWH